MKKKSIVLFSLLFLLIFNSIGLAAKLKLPEPSHSFYVYDEGNIIDDDVENYIVKTNEELHKETGAQIVVASINDLKNLDIKLFANELFKKWEIGGKKYDNGLLMLVAPKDREIWIEVGYGLEGILPDGKVGNIISKIILPYFREGDYSKGILLGFNQIIDEMEKEYNIELGRAGIDEDLYDLNVPYKNPGGFEKFGAVFIVFGIIIFLFIDMKFFRGLLIYSLLRGGRHRGSSFGGRGRSSGGGRSFGGGGRSGGGGAGGKW